MAGSFRPHELGGAAPSSPRVLPSLEEIERSVRETETSTGLDVRGRTLWALALMALGRRAEAAERLSAVVAAGRADALVRLLAFELSEAREVEPLEGVHAAIEADTSLDVGPVWLAVGGLLMESGRPERAAGAFERAAAAARRDGDEPGLLRALREAAQVAAARGRLDEALALVAATARRCSPSHDLLWLLRMDEARFEALRGRWAEAVRALEAALPLVEGVHPPDHPIVDHVLVSLAAARMELGAIGPDTRALLTRALGLRLARPDERAERLAEVRLLLGEHHRLEGHVEEALPLLAQAALALEAGPPGPAAQAFMLWSHALEARGLAEASRAQAARAAALLAASAGRAIDAPV